MLLDTYTTVTRVKGEEKGQGRRVKGEGSRVKGEEKGL
jgi:hypothetical protein